MHPFERLPMPARPRTALAPAITLTAAELTEMLNRIAIEPGRTAERLKHWARAGLLEPVGEQHPGTGRHRRYDFDSITVAAVLTVLSDMGLSVIGMEGLLANGLGQAQALRRGWEAGMEAYFVIPAGRRTGGRLLQGATYVHQGAWQGIKQKQRLLVSTIGDIVIDLGAIFAALEKEDPRVRS